MTLNTYVQDADTREELGVLALMDALAADERVSQRELAQRTGLTLKKVNYCLRKLLHKGHVKFHRAVQSRDKRAYLYILTPAGLRAKSRLTYRFLQVTLDYYNATAAHLRHTLQQIAAAGQHRVLLSGATDAARIALEQMGHTGVTIVGVLDDRYPDARFHQLPVWRTAQLQPGPSTTESEPPYSAEKQPPTERAAPDAPAAGTGHAGVPSVEATGDNGAPTGTATTGAPNTRSPDARPPHHPLPAWDAILITALDNIEQAAADLSDAGCTDEQIWYLQ